MASWDQERLRARLGELIAECNVPGASVGILLDGVVTEAAAGSANVSTGVESTPDTAFQIGSMTKAWTATVIMQLVDEGMVDLDAPVRRYLPEFRVAHPEVSEVVTPRHLLSHTSGIEGDHFEDTGRGDDCLERYVETCAKLHQTHPIGQTMSYCNTGFSILGRIIEVTTGNLWDDAMKERLFAPLGLAHTKSLPEEAILGRVSVGHISPTPDDPPEVAPLWVLTRSCGPAGATTSSTVGDILTMARLHLDDGRTQDGTQLVSSDGIRAMREPQVDVPDPDLCSHWGLGLMLFDWGEHRFFGHDGGTIGQSSRLRIMPEANLAVTLLMNGGETEKLYRALFNEILSDLVGVTVPALPAEPTTPPDVDLSRYAGTYERLSVRYDLAQEDGTLAGTATLSGPLTEVVPDTETKVRLKPVDGSTFLVYEEGEATPATAVFYQFEDGVPQYLHHGARANPRVNG